MTRTAAGVEPGATTTRAWPPSPRLPWPPSPRLPPHRKVLPPRASWSGVVVAGTGVVVEDRGSRLGGSTAGAPAARRRTMVRSGDADVLTISEIATGP
jgi:hypothetical protein